MIIISITMSLNLSAATLPEIKAANQFAVEKDLKSFIKEKSIIVMGYYHCTHMCNFVVQNLDKKLANFKDYPHVTYFGIDENEGPRDALQLSKRIVGPQKARWNFLVTDKKSIEKMAQSLSFEMKRNPVSGEINHELGLYSFNDGKISKLDVDFTEEQLYSNHTTWSKIKQFCSEFDPRKSKYGPLVMRMLSIGSMIFLVIAGFGFVHLRRKPV